MRDMDLKILTELDTMIPEEPEETTDNVVEEPDTRSIKSGRTKK